jgi:4-hydroxybenzoate polyprenyltransferase
MRGKMIKLKTLSRLLMAEQTVFALPWVLTGALLPFCFPEYGELFKWDQWGRWFAIIIGFVSARSAGMAFNRLIDRDIDAANPRTANRPLQTGEVSQSQVEILAWGSVFVFVLTCTCLNTICLYLSPLVISLIWSYSYMKRFTSSCHLVLGAIQFFGPFFAWAAITDSWGLAPVILGAAVLANISGVDIIYSLQDYSFEKNNRVYSLPVKIGQKNALVVARLLHMLVISILLILGNHMHAPIPYYVGVTMIAAIYLFFHSRIDTDNLEQINSLFFNLTSLVGLSLLMTIITTVLWRVIL